MTDELELALLRSEMSVTAVSATARQAKDLDIKHGAPLLLMREVHFSEGDRRILYSVNHHNSAVIDLTLVRVGART
jgi:DNA-binding GntR family transcriptional regulator